jgi:transposase-like protein
VCWSSRRYRAVLEVFDEGVPVIEVARRYGVARQAVHEWLVRYANGGGLAVLVRRMVPGWLEDRELIKETQSCLGRR